MDSPSQTLLAQYANSPTISALVDYANQWIDPQADINDFVSKVWDLKTASGFGLDLWGKIVGVSRVLNVPGNYQFFGFQNSDDNPFGQEPFYADSAANAFSLTDDAFRRLIMAKAMSNVSAGTCQSINTVLQYLFRDVGPAYVLDMLDMRMRYVFEGDLSAADAAIITNSGVLPRPAGVQIEVLTFPAATFGFASDSYPFGDGIFYSRT
jgi:Protein of unknown function (DUF2612)